MIASGRVHIPVVNTSSVNGFWASIGPHQIGGRARFVEMPHQHRVLARRGREFGFALAERVAKTKLALGISAPCGGSGKRPSPAGVEGPRFA